MDLSIMIWNSKLLFKTCTTFVRVDINVYLKRKSPNMQKRFLGNFPFANILLSLLLTIICYVLVHTIYTIYILRSTHSIYVFYSQNIIL